MILKSRYVYIKELELKIQNDEMPESGFKFTLKSRTENWHFRQMRRMQKIIQLRYFIEHDYEELKKLK